MKRICASILCIALLMNCFQFTVLAEDTDVQESTSVIVDQENPDESQEILNEEEQPIDSELPQLEEITLSDPVEIEEMESSDSDEAAAADDEETEIPVSNSLDDEVVQDADAFDWSVFSDTDMRIIDEMKKAYRASTGNELILDFSGENGSDSDNDDYASNLDSLQRSCDHMESILSERESNDGLLNAYALGTIDENFTAVWNRIRAIGTASDNGYRVVERYYDSGRLSGTATIEARDDGKLTFNYIHYFEDGDNCFVTMTLQKGNLKNTDAGYIYKRTSPSWLSNSLATIDITNYSKGDAVGYELAVVSNSTYTSQARLNVSVVSDTAFETGMVYWEDTLEQNTNYTMKDIGATRFTFVNNPVSVKGIKLNKTSIELPAGDTYRLLATLNPENATNKAVTWTSSNTGVATVNANGVVTAKKAGTTTITVKTKDGNKTAKCTVRVLFSDVTNKNLAAYKAIYSLADRGVVAGYGDHFDINGECTRGQFVLFLWRYAGKPTPKSTDLKFKDAADINKLAPDYAKAIAWGQEKGIVMGFTSGAKNGMFCPNDPCTRGQVVMFLWRYKGRPAVSGTIGFDDAAEINRMAPDYKKAIQWAVTKGITTGFSDNTFRPNQNCTRGQCVTFLYRI